MEVRFLCLTRNVLVLMTPGVDSSRCTDRCQCQTSDALFQHRHVEVEQEPCSEAREFHVGEQLGLVNLEYRLNRLHLHDNEFVDDKIHPVARLERTALVTDGDFDLSPHDQAAIRALLGETFLVDGFQQARPETSMDFDSRGDDRRSHALDVRA